MYRIAVVAEQEREAFHYAEQIARFCGEKGMFPKIEPYDDPERFFDAVRRDAPTNAVIALSGVAGLNTAEHLSSHTMTQLNNNRLVSMSVMLRLCKVFHCDIGDLMEVVEDETN